ncbi:MAG: Uncharacterised protein [Opitutia bacterium UBA7350]|nr:MAG: Uncharacterised protein [Opitutae bacterium UBA7350]
MNAIPVEIIVSVVAISTVLYIVGVWIAKGTLSRLPYFGIVGGGGILSSLIGSSSVMLSLIVYIAVTFAHGWAVGSRCNDAAISKFNATWAWIPLVWLGLLIPASKVSATESMPSPEAP